MINKILLITSLILMISCNNEKDAKLYDQKYVDSVIAANTSLNNKLDKNKLASTDTQNRSYTPKSLAEISNEAYAKVQEHSKIVAENLAKEYVRDIYKKGDEIYIKQYNGEIGTTYFINKHLEFETNVAFFYLKPEISGFTKESGAFYIDIMIEVEKTLSIANLDNCDFAIWFHFNNGEKLNYTDGFLSDKEESQLSKYRIKTIYIYDKKTNGVYVTAENINSDYFIKCFKAIKNKDYRIQK